MYPIVIIVQMLCGEPVLHTYYDVQSNKFFYGDKIQILVEAAKSKNNKRDVKMIAIKAPQTGMCT